MLKRASCICVAIFVLLSVSTAMAQDAPKGRWWRNSKTAKELKLSKEEIKKLDNAYNASRRRMIQKKSRVESEQFELKDMVERRKFNESAVKSQHKKLEKARSDLASEQFGFVIESRKIIGRDRFNRLVDIQRKSKRRR